MKIFIHHPVSASKASIHPASSIRSEATFILHPVSCIVSEANLHPASSSFTTFVN
ncbi:MAG: hypothetical protein M0Q38_01935 [Bacteroidales bacterium]|nr:hypothetical protein [Bacteroidales bacterium]